MLEQAIKQQLTTYLANVKQPIELRATLGSDGASREMGDLLGEIAALRPDLISVRTDGQGKRTPSFTVGSAIAGQRVCFAAIPLGLEFTSLVLSMLWAGGHSPKESAQIIDQIRALDQDLNFEIFLSLSCHICPDVVQALTLMAVLNPRICVTAIDGGLFEGEIASREIMGVPTVYLNGHMFSTGALGIEEILQKVDSNAASRDAQRLSALAAFDTLVIGAGPAGATAAIYAARKGIRTGMIAERLGGQVNDTNEISNYPGLAQTTGPAYGSAIIEQVRTLNVEIINAQRVKKLIAPPQPKQLCTIELENGAQLKSKTVIIATGARWRNVGCPGELEYKTKGVAYCPHCDGPLFKGKKVAVIGGGNSGIEAAIDLAGVTQHVTVLEFLPNLKADAILIDKLNTLPNVTVFTNVQTTEITGSQGKVDGIKYKKRDTPDAPEIALPLEGVFVQIGLVADTAWIGDALGRTPAGEIMTDPKGLTNVAGIFAAGDCTTSPYKQIVTAAGSGACAALSAFDYLIRS